ncbi:accessory Sec system glycosylation chaperone GtfB [Streptococcus saliviloxodontae]|uniref:UDP-N-acetylglucosamine--peptide N-acetylglucosaminyltransferase stabilizing protein GtfB n=1 Tax=Streptococcus saliviloxodontae TaxID=1349416 RepID=A0ABS2PMY3_9STRE|nr:accessory Sec system glycosylation chaperone GtfB [Streptococcus saliviloxodontae]MBM7636163.1 accessory Sec system glycosyltransferase GtfB [Streptococcus saliviloxodontae]
MIRLFEWLNQETLDLHYSLETAGLSGTTVLLNDDGCLPEGVTSPYSYFCGMSVGQGKARYFNQIRVPDYWQITGNNTKGEIWNKSDKMADIFYHEPSHLRFVKTVDWLDKKGQVRLSEHYNQSGWVFAKTYFDDKQQGLFKTYLTQAQEEVLIENLRTGAILLNWKDKVHHFTKKLDFILFYLKESGLDLSAIWYNSLAMPFMISYYLDLPGDDILFWQETIGEDVPGNMRIILSGRTHRSKRVIVQDKATYDKMQLLLSEEEKKRVSYLGYLYPEKSENSGQQKILTLTNSDQLEHLEFLVTSLPNYQFHIGALTEMSPYLMGFAQYDNVHLYPNIAQDQVRRLFETCSIYLDINHGSEILSAVRQAFEYNQLVLAFDKTSHNPQLTLADNCFQSDKPEQLVQYLSEISHIQDLVKQQRQGLGQDNPENYRRLLGD